MSVGHDAGPEGEGDDGDDAPHPLHLLAVVRQRLMPRGCQAEQRARDALDERQVARRRLNVPLGLESSAEDIANAVLFLASDKAVRITGARLVVDGGCSVPLVPPDAEV